MSPKHGFHSNARINFKSLTSFISVEVDLRTPKMTAFLLSTTQKDSIMFFKTRIIVKMFQSHLKYLPVCALKNWHGFVALRWK